MMVLLSWLLPALPAHPASFLMRVDVSNADWILWGRSRSSPRKEANVVSMYNTRSSVGCCALDPERSKEGINRSRSAWVRIITWIRMTYLYWFLEGWCECSLPIEADRWLPVISVIPCSISFEYFPSSHFDSFVWLEYPLLEGMGGPSSQRGESTWTTGRYSPPRSETPTCSSMWKGMRTTSKILLFVWSGLYLFGGKRKNCM